MGGRQGRCRTLVEASAAAGADYRYCELRHILHKKVLDSVIRCDTLKIRKLARGKKMEEKKYLGGIFWMGQGVALYYDRKFNRYFLQAEEVAKSRCIGMPISFEEKKGALDWFNNLGKSDLERVIEALKILRFPF